MSGTLNEQLQQIADTKTEIANAINEQGIEVTASDPFATYARKIRQIEGSGGGSTSNAFVLGQSEYFQGDLNNPSWLKSEAQWNTKALYPSMYEYVLQNVQAGTKNFADINSEYDAYSFVLDEANESFRLPLFNGTENIVDYSNASEVAITTASTAGTVLFEITRNGVVTEQVSGQGSSNRAGLAVYDKDDNLLANFTNSTNNLGTSTTGGSVVNFNVSKGQVVKLYSAILGGTGTAKFYPLVGNGSLYYYVGESVQNANLIDVGNITEALSSKVDINGIIYNPETATLYIGVQND